MNTPVAMVVDGHESFDPLRTYVHELVPESPSSQTHDGFTPFILSLYSTLPTTPDSPSLSTVNANELPGGAYSDSKASAPAQSVNWPDGASNPTSSGRPRNFSRPIDPQPRPLSPHVRFAVASTALSSAELDKKATEGVMVSAVSSEAASLVTARPGKPREHSIDRQSQWLEALRAELAISGGPSPLTCPRPPPPPPPPLSPTPSPPAAPVPESGAIAPMTPFVANCVLKPLAQQRNVLRKARPAGSANTSSRRKGPNFFARLRLPAHTREATLDSGLWAAELSPAPYRGVEALPSAAPTSRSITPHLETDIQVGNAALGIVPALAKPGQAILLPHLASRDEQSRGENDVSAGESVSRESPSAPSAQSAESEYSLYSLPPSPASTQVGMAGIGPPAPTRHARDASRASTLSTMQKLDLAVETRRRASGPVRPRRVRYRDPIGPEDFLQLGIVLHEAGQVEQATSCFEMSSAIDGGCCSGMLLYGLSLRYGWGCKADPSRAFDLLKQAAESIIGEFDAPPPIGKAVSETALPDEGARTELALAFYELGVSYRFGWGVQRNKVTAMSYFRFSVELGDLDAQQDLERLEGYGASGRA